MLWTRAASADKKDMPKWSIRDLWGRLTQKKALNPEMRNILMSLDGVYDAEKPGAAASSHERERPTSGQPNR